MKGGVAALVIAAEELARSGASGAATWWWRSPRTRSGTAWARSDWSEEPLFEGLGAALVAEPTSLELYVAEKGRLLGGGATLFGRRPTARCRSWRERRRRHGRLPYRWERVYASGVPADPLLGAPTLNIGLIEGGVRPNVVPDRCSTTLDMRTVPGMSHAEIRSAAEAMLREGSSPRDAVETQVVAGPA